MFRSTKWHLYLIWAAVIAFAAHAISSVAAQAQVRDLVIAANPQQPFKYVKDGKPTGIDVDVMRRILDQLGIPHRFEFVESDTRLQVEARSGRVDMLLLYSITEERKTYLTYPGESYIDLTWSFFIRAEDAGKFTSNEFSDLKGIRIGATRGISYTQGFWDAGLDLDLEPQNATQLEKLLAGRIDMVPLNSVTARFEAYQDGVLDRLATLPKPLKSKAYFNTFSKASDHPELPRLIANYDALIAEMKQSGELEGIINRYLGPPPMISTHSVFE